MITILKYIGLVLFCALLSFVAAIAWHFGIDIYRSHIRQRVMDKLAEVKSEISE